jgi:hypothetical protein
MDTFGRGLSSDHRSLGWEQVTGEDLIRPQDVGVADEPAVGVGMNYSPPRWETPQWDDAPIGLASVDPGFSELEESTAEPAEQPELGWEMSDCEPGVQIEEPVMNPDIGAEMLGSDGVVESPEVAVGLPDPDVENGSTSLFPEAEGFFAEEDSKDNWL